MTRHFEHIRIGPLRGLKKGDLRKLGRINVLCGRNNSGKSTIVECIADSTKNVRGVTFAGATLDALREALREAAGLQKGLSTYYTGPFDQVLEDTITERDNIWYADDHDTLLLTFARGMSQTPVLASYEFRVEVARSAWKSLIEPQPTVTLLPAKRRLETTCGMKFDGVIQPAGPGVTNAISFARNQGRYSEERQFYNNLVTAFGELSDGHGLEITPDRHHALHLRFTLPESVKRQSSVTLDADDCGLGLQDLLLILYFALDSSIDVLCIEEPESHLHPDLQRRLLAYLRAHTDKQYFLTTHSSVLLDTSHVDRVFLCTADAEIAVNDETSRARMLTDLGYSVADNLVADLLLLVEGPSDKAVLEGLLPKLQLPERFLIKMWPLGGDVMSQLDLSVVAENRNVMALIDRDPESDKVRRDFMDQCRQLGIQVHRLERRAIENYFSIRALGQVLGSQIPSAIHTLDPNAPVEQQIGCNPKRKNYNIASAMTLEELQDTDLYKFLLTIKGRLLSISS